MAKVLPFLPLFVDDLLADTHHLSLAQFGAYSRLLMECWRTPGCSVPDKPKWIADRLRVDDQEFEAAVLPVLGEFFKRRRGRWYHSELRDRYERALTTHEQRSLAGTKGAHAANTLRGKQNGFGPAEAGPQQPEPKLKPESDTDGGDALRTDRATAEVVPLRRPDPAADLTRRLVSLAGGDADLGGRLGNADDVDLVRYWLDWGLAPETIELVVGRTKRTSRIGSLAYYKGPMIRQLQRDAKRAQGGSPLPELSLGPGPSRPDRRSRPAITDALRIPPLPRRRGDD